MKRERNPLPQLAYARFNQLRNRIAPMQIRRSQELAVEAGPVNRSFTNLATARTQTFAPITPGTRFGKPETEWGAEHRNNLWTNRWLRIQLPAAQSPDERGNRRLAWQCNGETTIFIDGEPWAGLDASHASCPLPDTACVLWIDVSLYHTAIGGSAHRPIDRCGVEFLGAQLVIRDPEAWATYQDMDLLAAHMEQMLEAQGIRLPAWALGQFPEIRSVPPLLRHLLGAAEDACDAFATGGMPALREAIAKMLKQFPAESWQPFVHLVGHSHLDLLWLWPEAATLRKGIHTLSTTIRLLERYPEFRFTISQPGLLRALAAEAPGQYAQMCRYIKEGRVELLGAFDIEPDVHIPCGEALARSLVHGQALTTQLTGKPSNICWLSDTFGFTACLPQMLRLAGVDAFFTAKMLVNAINRFPHVAFTWRGPDGSDVDALCVPQWNNTLRFNLLQDSVREHAQIADLPEMLIPVGVGDGGGGVTEELCERASRMGNQAGLPRTAWSTAEKYYAAQAAARGRLPVYQGELYLELHQGIFTSQVRFKRVYRELERALQTWEAARAITGGGPVDSTPWLRLAFAQFHDALPGSSIDLVYEQLGAELQTRVADAMAAANKDLSTPSGSTTLFNPLPISRKAVVAIPGQHKAIAVNGKAVPVQAAGDETLALLELDGLSAVQVQSVAAGSSSASTISTTPTALDNGRVRAVFDSAAQLTSLCVDGFDLHLSAPAGLRLHADQPAYHDAWDIDHDAMDHVLPLPAAKALTVVESGPVRARLRTTQKIGEQSHATIDYVLDAAQPWLQVEVTIEWHERHRLLKYHVPTSWLGRLARYGTPFGSITRPQLPAGPLEEAMWENPLSRWLTVGDDAGNGLAVITEASYGASVRNGLVGLSLLRSSTEPDPENDQGAHHLRFAIGRHAINTDADGSAAAADRLYTPPMLLAQGAAKTPPFSWRQLGSLLPSWVEPIAGGVILRAHETIGSDAKAELHFAKAPRSVEYIDLLSRVIGEVDRPASTRCTVAARPHQIVSVRVLW